MFTSFFTSDTLPSAVTSLAVSFNLLSSISKMKSPRIGSELWLLMTRERAIRRLLSAVLETVNFITGDPQLVRIAYKGTQNFRE